MPTTTLRLKDELKGRIASAARRAGKSPHIFMVEAIADRVDEAELRADFERTADERMAEIESTGMALDWGETKAWLRARAQGKPAKRPRLRKLAKLK